jgi:hypothetical protein
MNTLNAAELVDRENHAWEELKELLDSGQNTYGRLYQLAGEW